MEGPTCFELSKGGPFGGSVPVGIAMAKGPFKVAGGGQKQLLNAPLKLVQQYAGREPAKAFVSGVSVESPMKANHRVGISAR